jgi:hypothetical protein
VATGFESLIVVIQHAAARVITIPEITRTSRSLQKIGVISKISAPAIDCIFELGGENPIPATLSKRHNLCSREINEINFGRQS